MSKLLKERQSNWFYGVMKENHAAPPMLIVKHRAGNETAYGYHFLSKKITFNPSEGIKLTFIDSESAETITIEGRNLISLWETLTSHRVTFIRELDNDFTEPSEDDLCIKNISIQV